MDQDETWQAGRPRPRPHCVRWRPSSHAKRGTVAPLSKFTGTGFAYVCIICGPCLLSPNGLIHQDALGTEIGLGPCHIVLDGDPDPPSQRGTDPPFSAHVCCGSGHMAGWIEMQVGREAGLSPGDIMLDGDPALPPKRGTAPNFRPTSVVAKWLHGSRCH